MPADPVLALMLHITGSVDLSSLEGLLIDGRPIAPDELRLLRRTPLDVLDALVPVAQAAESLYRAAADELGALRAESEALESAYATSDLPTLVELIPSGRLPKAIIERLSVIYDRIGSLSGVGW